MNADAISVVDIAREVGKRKQSIFKIISRLGINIVKRKGENSRGQVIAYVTADDKCRIIDYISNSKSEIDNYKSPERTEGQTGLFYLIQLEPEHDPLRVKMGFTVNLNDRLRHHKCSAPYAKVIKTWPCKILWERTAIDCVVGDCSQVSIEVYKVNSGLDKVMSKLDRFFELMVKK